MDTRLELYTLTEDYDISNNEVCQYLYNRIAVLEITATTFHSSQYSSKSKLIYTVNITSEDALALKLIFPNLEINKKCHITV